MDSENDGTPGWVSGPDEVPATTPTSSRKRGVVAGATLLAAGGVAGAILTGTLSAGAATTPTPSPSANGSSSAAVPPTSDSDGDGPHGQGSFPEHGTAAHEALEKPVTGANATKAQAAAVKSVGSGTAGAVTTDATGDGYEVTVMKSDGSSVEVHLDSSFAVQDHGGRA